MLIMRRGEVMSQGNGLESCTSYAKTHKTKVKSVEICSTLGGFHELVVHWKDKAIGMFWSRDREALREYIAEQGWKHDEYSVQAMPVLLDHLIPPPVTEPEESPEEPEDDPEEPPARIRRTRHAEPAPEPVKTAPRVVQEPPARIRRKRNADRAGEHFTI